MKKLLLKGGIGLGLVAGLVCNSFAADKTNVDTKNFAVEFTKAEGCVGLSMKDEMNLPYLQEKGFITIKKSYPNMEVYEATYYEVINMKATSKVKAVRTFYKIPDECNADYYNFITSKR